MGALTSHGRVGRVGSIRLIVDLPTDISMALQRAARDNGETPTEMATTLVAEALATLGYIENVNRLNENSETKGTA